MVVVVVVVVDGGEMHAFILYGSAPTHLLTPRQQSAAFAMIDADDMQAVERNVYQTITWAAHASE